jgi:glutathione synthase/RimK-type ligase-like ATP-grasp enzyme
MPRVLIASPVDWLSTSRLPAMFARAGIDCDLLDGGGTAAASSSRLHGKFVVAGGVGPVVREAVRIAERYDRVMLSTEETIRAALRLGGGAGSVLRGSYDGLAAACDKTRFSLVAQAGGLRVSEFAVADSAEEATSAARRIGGRVVVKGKWGVGGSSVRVCDSPEQVSSVVAELGTPVLVEAFVIGELLNMPCLYEDGMLVAAMASRKLELCAENGPSSVNEFVPVDDRLHEACAKVGEVFGFTGFTSADVILVDDGPPVFLEVNPRQVHQLHLGRSVGVDMARAFADVLAGRWDGVARLAGRNRTVRLFPQDLIRHREQQGAWAGTRAWLRSPGALDDVPWDDFGLLAHQIREYSSATG